MAGRVSQASPQAEAGRLYHWVVLGLGILGQTSGSLVLQGLSSLWPFIQAELQLSRTQVGLMVSMINTGQAASALAAGWVTDRAGVRRVLPVGEVLVALGLISLASINGLGAAIPALFVAGVGCAIINPTTIASVYLWFTSRSRGTALGILKSAVPFTGIVTAATLPALSLALGWRRVLVVLGFPILALAALSFSLYRDKSSPVSDTGSSGQTRSSIRWLLLNRSILSAILYMAALNCVHLAVTTFLMLFMIDKFAVSVVVAGSFLAILQVGGFAGRLGMGVISDTLFVGRRKNVLAATGVIATSSLIIISLLPSSSPLWLLPILAFILGIAVAGWQGVYFALTTELAGPALAATSVGLGNTSAQIGRMMFVPFFGYMVDVTGNYVAAWLAAASIIGLATIVLTLGVKEEQPER